MAFIILKPQSYLAYVHVASGVEGFLLLHKH